MLKREQFETVAQKLGLETAVLQAVAEVESGSRGGFLSDGRVVILFEAHIFWRRLKLRGIDPAPLLTANADILSPTWNRTLYRGGRAEWERFEKAAAIDLVAARESASWGAFQIMGFNYSRCGEGSVGSFVAKMASGEAAQMELFALFLQNSGLTASLRTKDWITFAKRYNGSGYAANRYDVRLKDAYDRYSRLCCS
ncbi:MAG: N-acetylmuramidase family protein [Tidjanibacter sp.]|nr:N-acetylmuramidase family protein [Tidjanibacter sp.]